MFRVSQVWGFGVALGFKISGATSKSLRSKISKYSRGFIQKCCLQLLFLFLLMAHTQI